MPEARTTERTGPDYPARLIPGRLRRWFGRRMGNPLKWSAVDRSLLWLALVVPWAVVGWVLLWFLKDHPEHIPVYDWTYISDVIAPFYTITVMVAVVLIALALLLRRRSPENRLIVHLTIQGFAIHTALLIYFSGTLTTIMWIALATGLMVLALLFDTAAVFWGGVTATAIVTGTFLANMAGWIPYAPWFAEPPFANGKISGSSITLIFGFSLFAIIFSLFFFFFLYAVSRWREHERQVVGLSEFLRQTFGRYLSKDVLDALIENPEAVALGGRKQKVTILMTDLRGFTQFSERLAPEQLVRLLNRYFRVMMDICERHHGTVNDIIGDALLVTFGAPVELKNHAQAAVACAICMQNAMAALNEENLAEALPELEMGIGLNTAEVVVGNIGSEKRSKFGVIGSGVNLASRIESSTVGGQVLVSESVVSEAGGALRLDDQREIRPKGAEQALRIYEVGGIGAPYHLALSAPPDEPLGLSHPIAVTWQRLEGKEIAGAPALAGTLASLSRRGAALRAQGPLDELVNLKLNLTGVGPQLARKDFYAKVLGPAANGADFRLRFTAVPPEVSAFFEACLRHLGKGTGAGAGEGAGEGEGHHRSA